MPPGLSSTLERADALRGRGFFLRAETLYSRILRRSEKGSSLWLEAALGSAAGLRALGKVKQASALLGRAAPLARRHPWAREALELERVMVLRAAGGYEQSVKKLSALLRRARQGRRLDEAAYLLWAMGGALRFQGRLGDSLSAFRRSLSLARRIQDPVAAGYALFGLGGTARILGRLKDSERFYARAKAVFDDTDDLFGKAYAHCGLANALRQGGRLREAERLYRKAYFLYKSLEDEVDLAYVDWGMGKIHLQRGELSAALSRLKAAHEAFSKGGETRGEVLALNAIAQALHAAGKTAEAERKFDAAVRLARRHRLHAHLEVFT